LFKTTGTYKSSGTGYHLREPTKSNLPLPMYHRTSVSWIHTHLKKPLTTDLLVYKETRKRFSGTGKAPTHAAIVPAITKTIRCRSREERPVSGYEQAKQDEREKNRAAESQSESWREVGCLFDMQSQKRRSIDRQLFFSLLFFTYDVVYRYICRKVPAAAAVWTGLTGWKPKKGGGG